jgi:hypothetical protein
MSASDNPRVKVKPFAFPVISGSKNTDAKHTCAISLAISDTILTLAVVRVNT